MYINKNFNKSQTKLSEEIGYYKIFLPEVKIWQ